MSGAVQMVLRRIEDVQAAISFSARESEANGEVISRDSFCRAVHAVMNSTLSDTIVDVLFTTLDADEDGNVSQRELFNLLSQRKGAGCASGAAPGIVSCIRQCIRGDSS